MTDTMRKAITVTLEEWKKLDVYHKGCSYEKAVKNLETWLKEDDNRYIVR